jgi:2-polyprenyl-3-methyl-5-hydroxy-6-metoxy-1,4-benzoquinol methylase
MAGTYDKLTPDYMKLKSRAIRNISSYVKISDAVLDFGCGTGTIACGIADQVKSVDGIDISSSMVESARRKAVEMEKTKVRFIKTTIYDSELMKESYDVVLAVGILHLVKDRHKVLHRINELLKQGGLFISSTVCMGDKKTIPRIMNLAGSALGKTGIVPSLCFPEVQNLQTAIENEGFKITEAKSRQFKGDERVPTGDEFLITHFVAARK